MINCNLQSPVQYVKKVGPKRAALMLRLGIETIDDLLYLSPRRYEDRSNLIPIGKIKEGEIYTIMGKVITGGEIRTRSRLKIYQAVIGDDTGMVYVTWFNQPYMKDYFKPGVAVILYGKVTKFRGTKLQINVPEYEILEGDEVNSIHMGGIVPIYPATGGLNQKFIRSLVRDVLKKYINEVEEIVPGEIRGRENLLPLRKALWNMHFPDDLVLQKRARYRMVFDEFFLLQLGIGMRKHQVKNLIAGISQKTSSDLVERFQKLLPYKLTAAQQKSLKEIVADMQDKKPMNRLLQGDVGSGKTVVAIYALVYTVGCGYQGALMVPTGILARQHYAVLKELLAPLGIKIALLIGELSPAEHNRIRERIAGGDIDIIIGTHALIQEAVKYNNLGFIVIDEQHKFGVMQRALLRSKAKLSNAGICPDVLVMTATPIPRSLALTVYGDIDISVIDELPPGRGKIVTYWIREDKLKKAYDFIKKEITKGRQAYIVYPLIKESEKVKLKAAHEMINKLQVEEFPELRMSLLHGRMPIEDKVHVMSEFRQGKIHILVATTVIEVGIDIKNATVMLIEHAERFGLSQLHQLRGRIGRSSNFSYCILQGNPGTVAGQKRLKAMEETSDGFKISQEDLAIRGPGEFFGMRQHGLPEMRVGNFITDIGVMEIARKEAERVLQNDPGLQSAEHRNLFLKVKQIFGKKLELLSV